MSDLFGRQWRFLTSAPTLSALPPEGPPEVAFAGRSNVGKSSLINALTGMSSLARTSNTPGRTQALNFFAPGPRSDDPDDAIPPIAIVDLPGFGFARAPKAQVEAWTGLIRRYLTGRATLRRVFVLIDSRHGLKPIDLETLDRLDFAGVSYQIVLTKVDKLKPAALEQVIAATSHAVRRRAAAHPDVLASSSIDKAGLAELRTEIRELSAAP